MMRRLLLYLWRVLTGQRSVAAAPEPPGGPEIDPTATMKKPVQPSVFEGWKITPPDKWHLAVACGVLVGTAAAQDIAQVTLPIPCLPATGTGTLKVFVGKAKGVKQQTVKSEWNVACTCVQGNKPQSTACHWQQGQVLSIWTSAGYIELGRRSGPFDLSCGVAQAFDRTEDWGVLGVGRSYEIQASMNGVNTGTPPTVAAAEFDVIYFPLN